MIKKTFSAPCLLLVCLGLGACASEPVSPWQRGNLAKPVMTRDKVGLQSAFEQHAYASKEATSGGYAVGGGGCGCN